MTSMTIDLDHDQYERLARLAEASGRALGEVVREALGQYLAGRAANGIATGTEMTQAPPIEQEVSPDDRDDWRRRLDDLLARARAGVPEEQLAGKSDRELIRDYLIRQGARVVPAPPGPPSAEQRRQFEELLARIRAGVPDDVTPAEIERDISIASAEARFERIARQAASRAPRTTSE